MTITGGSSLPKEDIDRMVREAEEHAAEDKKRREEADTRNQAEQAVYSTEKLLKDEADKISEATREAVQKDVDAVKEALKGDDIEAVKTAMATLSESGMKIGQEIYAKQQADEPPRRQLLPRTTSWTPKSLTRTTSEHRGNQRFLGA